MLKASLTEKTEDSEKLSVELQEQKDKVSLHVAEQEKLVELEKIINESANETSEVRRQVIQLKSEINDKNIQIEALNTTNLLDKGYQVKAVELEQQFKALDEKLSEPPKPNVDQQQPEISPLKIENTLAVKPEVAKIEENLVEDILIPEKITPKQVVIDKSVEVVVKASEGFKPLAEGISVKDDQEDTGLTGKASSLFRLISKTTKKKVKKETKDKNVEKPFTKGKSTWKSYQEKITNFSKSPAEKVAKPAEDKLAEVKLVEAKTADVVVVEPIPKTTPPASDEKKQDNVEYKAESSNDVAESIAYIKGKFKGLFGKKPKG
jgi:hypothetical protein